MRSLSDSRIIPAALLVCSFPSMIFCQTRAKKPASDSMSEMPEVLVAPLFIETAGFTSAITMVNELNFAVTAQVVLFDRHGARITYQTVAFPAHSRQAVLVGDLLRQANSGETMGSVEVLPDTAKVITMAIAAQLSIDGSGASMGQHIEEEFLMVGMPGSGVLRSSGASLEGGPFVALRNTAAAAQTATISCITEKGATTTQQQVQLAAGGWALLQACTSSSNAAVSLIGDVLVSPDQAASNLGAFGVSVAETGQAGSLAVFGFSWRGASRGAMLSSQNFVDAGTFRSGNTVFTGVPVGAANHLPGAFFTPQVALANFGAQPVNATVQFSRTSDSGPEASRVATVSVPAMSAQTIALPDLTGDPGLRNSFIVQSDAAPGTLFASLAAVNAPGFGLVEQIGKDQLTLANGGGHPWDLSGGQDAVLLLFNHSAVAKYFNVKIGSGGVLWQRPYLLAPMETRAISIRELIAGQIKDQDGKLLPQSLERGEIGWFNANPAEGKGRLMQIDPASQTVAANTRVARNFSCSYTFVLCGASISPDSITLNDGGSSSPLEVIPAVCLSVTPSNCFGQSSSYGGLGYTYEWEVNGPAEVNGSYTESTATLLGTGAGTGYFSCMVTSNYNGSYCQQTPQGTLNVTPTVSVTAGPTAILAFHAGASNPQSTCVSVTAASNPSSGGTFSWTTTSSKITLSNANTATVKVCSAADQWSGGAGDITVTVTYTLNGVASQPAKTTITILKPAAVAQQSSTLNSTAHTCTSSPFADSCHQSTYSDVGGPYTYTSYIRTIKYNITDLLFGTDIELNMNLQESYASGNVTIGAGIGTAISDCFYYCSSLCRQGKADSAGSEQTILANGFPIASKSVTWTCSDATVE